MRTNRDKRLSNAVRLALGAGLAASLAMGPTAFAAEEEDSAELERVQVTGSRLSRLDLEGALPVTVIDREDIDLSGHISVADLLRGTTFNSAGSFRPQSGSSAQSFAGLSLRGLGSSRTLILIDG
ncbi:MAG: TonB-dependent receptor plug domain-containing protein, partial [Gammaproteobacteria bacterium]|nr:TonB-dependent receptor plug domain-containing protein [Gammaproteobacteria bacterium]